ncbi:MAG: hypothetical protein ACI30I_06555 [Parabacteroides sp.]
MSNKEDDLLYDEDDAVKFIRNYIPQELKSRFKNDDILYILDLIYDYYESNGFMDEDESDDKIVEIDEDELIEYVIKNAKRDQVGQFEAEEIAYIVQGEMEYCDSINMFD